MEKYTIFWFRRDLRIEDNHGLFKALLHKEKVIPIFIFDKNILKKLPKSDARLEFIFLALRTIDDAMKRNRCSLGMYHGTPEAILKQLIKKWHVGSVVCNEDYEPYAKERDESIKSLLAQNNISFEMYKDQVIFEKDEIVKDDGTPYRVYTPYSRKWLSHFSTDAISDYPSQNHLNQLAKIDQPKLKLTDLGFEFSVIASPQYKFNKDIISSYEETRNFPALDETTRIGTHLRFGTLSVRKMVRESYKIKNPTFLKELIWREFFMQILWHFPHTMTRSFKPQYDRIEWRNNPSEFKKWCDDYFFLKHRNEPRGIGGIFFDYLQTGDWGKDFEFVQDVGSYFHQFIEKTLLSLKDEKWNEEEKKKQLHKRSRYAEFNLLYDRGTKFGLETGGNIDAILMSMPPLAAWE